MKLNKIYISAFGGLKDFTLNLNDGLNVIFGNNEDGKTTVATFIKCMFYGTGTKKANLAEKEAKMNLNIIIFSLFIVGVVLVYLTFRSI